MIFYNQYYNEQMWEIICTNGGFAMQFSLSFAIALLLEGHSLKLFNLPLFIAAILVLLIALYICVCITRRNRLYIHHKKKPKTKAYV